MALTMADGVITVDEGDPVAVAARLRHLEEQIAGMPAEAIDAMGSDIGSVQSWLSGVLAKVTARATRLKQQGQPADPKKTAAKAGLGDRDAAKAARRGDAMQQMPEALGALEDGSIGVGHADVLTNQANRLSGAKKKAFGEESDRLVADAIAEGLSVRAFEKRCREAVDRLMGDDGIAELDEQRRRSRAKTWIDPLTGMTHLHGEWDPIRGEAVRRALDAEIAARVAAGAKATTPRRRAQVAAEALHGLICGQRVSRAESAAVTVLIDLDAMVEGVATGPDGARRTSQTHGGHDIPVETIRRMACEAQIIPVVLNGAGQPLDVGRERRLATRAQRVALRAQYPTCGMDADCTVAFDDCQIHHVDIWSNGGRTDLERMVPGCDTHHHLVHDGGWTLTRKPDGTWQLNPPQRPPP